MTRKQFDEGMHKLLREGAVTRIYALIGAGEADGVLLSDEKGYYSAEYSSGILVCREEFCRYVPYESIIALSAVYLHKAVTLARNRTGRHKLCE